MNGAPPLAIVPADTFALGNPCRVIGDIAE